MSRNTCKAGLNAALQQGWFVLKMVKSGCSTGQTAVVPGGCED